MREHQIIITLKPEQFQAVQRLFKASGAKSMGIFVRQQLLTALGLDNAAAPKAAGSPSTPNIKRVLGELNRLHAEVQLFAAEALAQPYNEMIGEMLDADNELELAPPPTDAPLPPTAETPSNRSASTFALHNVLADFADAAEELADLALKGLELAPRRGILESPGNPDELLKGADPQTSDPLQDILQAPAEQKPATANPETEKTEAEPEQFNYVRVPPQMPIPPAPPPPAHDDSAPKRPSGGGHPGISGGPPPRKRR